MKQITLAISLILFLSSTAFGQTETELKGKEKLPDSWINVGIGSGMTYGGLGVKTVIGQRNSGLLLATGYIPYTMGWLVGAQASFNWFYVNAGYGVSRMIVVNDQPYKKLEAFNFNVGGMINLGKQNRTFIDLGFGITAGEDRVVLPGLITGGDRLTFALGIGRRLGGASTK